MVKRFSERRVVITGAASGIGKCIAQRFYAEGAEVIGLDCKAASERLPYRLITVDVADSVAVRLVNKQLMDENQHLDILVNAAGILRMGAPDQLSDEDWCETFGVNLNGPYFMMQAWYGLFKAQQRGAIVNIASNAAHVPRVNMAAYGASKAALIALSHSIALELAPYGVRCNVVSPGSCDTPMLAGMSGQQGAVNQLVSGSPAQFKLGIPLGKIAVPDDIADCVLFLASDQASHITMQDIVIDGGATLAA